MENVIKNRYEKKSNSNQAIVKLLHIIGKEKGKIIVGIVFSIIGTILTIFAPLVLSAISKLILDSLPGKEGSVTMDYNLLWIYAAIGVSAFALGAIFQFVQTYIVSGVVARGSEYLRNEMAKKVNHLPLNYFDTRNTGDILSYVTNDVDIVGTTLNQTLATVISALITVVGVIILLFIIDWRIGLVATILVPIILFVLSAVGGLSQKHFEIKNEYTAKVSSQAEESYTAFNILRVFNANKANINKFAEKNYALEKAMAKADHYSGMSIPLTTFLSNVMFCAIALVGGVIVASIAKNSGSSASIEDINRGIVQVVTAVSLGDQLVTPITQIASNVAVLQQTVASAQRIFAFLDEENEPDESYKTKTIDEIKGNIAFEHVKFGYTSDRVIIHDFCEVGKPGQKIAIVGPTGAGKTTMVNLLMRFYELNSGKITIEGIDTKEMNRSYVRGLFGMVLQDTWLFEGTIMENLKYSRPEATDEEVYAACKATHCDEFIRQQPGGYNHMLGEDCGLAAGQKQLLTIARAMIQNAPMLILDEATSSVDTRTELLIQDAMDQLMKGRTSFVIAHRLSTIKNSNLIIVMRDGDVIETGNHDELMKLDGFYAALYNSQFTGKGPQFS